MALSFNNTSEVLLKEYDKLDHQPINSKLAILCEYDKAISRSFINSIGIWHCSWYYDSTVSGYSEGDVVWLNTEDPYKFVATHSKIIKDYTDLKSEILIKLPEYDSKDDAIIEKYLNALSGYVDSKSKNVKPLEPIFDLGNYSKPIQLAVSLKNNNKGSVSDDSSWKKLFVDDSTSEERIRELISVLKDKKLEKHLIDYHLSGNEETVKAQLSDYLDEAETTMYYDSLPSIWYANSESEHGFDYVTNYVRRPLVLSGEVSQYQAARYWKSGWMEQFGTVAIDNPLFSISGDLFFRLQFDWNILENGSGTKAYEEGELANRSNVITADESDTNLIPPKDGYINVVFENPSITIGGSKTVKPFKNSNYNLTIYPIYQSQNMIESSYLPVGFGEDSIKQQWNNNFLTNEIIEESKDKFGFSIRKGTRIVAPYISYYAIGIGDF